MIFKTLFILLFIKRLKEGVDRSLKKNCNAVWKIRDFSANQNQILREINLTDFQDFVIQTFLKLISRKILVTVKVQNFSHCGIEV